MTAIKYEGCVVSNHLASAQVREVQVEAVSPHPLLFKAGQSIRLELLTLPGEPGRYFSMASPPHEPLLTLLVNCLPGQPSSQYIEALKPGDSVEFSGPFGTFHAHSDSPRKWLLLGTGTGLAPLYAMGRERLHLGDRREMEFLIGVKTEADRLYKAELEALQSAHGNIRYAFTLTQPFVGWGGLAGRVTEHLSQRELDPAEWDVYLCGWREMIFECLDLLQEKGFGEEQIFYERYS